MRFKDTKINLKVSEDGNTVTLTVINPDGSTQLEKAELPMAMAGGFLQHFKEQGAEVEEATQALHDAEAIGLENYQLFLAENLNQTLIKAYRPGKGMAKLTLIFLGTEQETLEYECPLNVGQAILHRCQNPDEGDLAIFRLHPDSEDLTPSAEHIQAAFDEFIAAPAPAEA